ncbi:MAG TPA: GAF domain-containing protein [Ktedonobacterales bacterium]|nr:GAF domain-containing protein [Ktedonobacterales bacterium]
MRGSAAEQLHDLALCGDIIQTMTKRSASLEDGLDDLLTIMCRRLGASEMIGTLLFTKPDGQAIAFRYERDRTQFEPDPINMERGLVRIVRVSQQLAVYKDLKSSRPTGYIQVAPNVQSEIAIPLLIGDRVGGVIDLASTSNRAFGDEDKHWLRHLATLMQIVLWPAGSVRESPNIESVMDELLKTALEATRLAGGYAVIILADGSRVVPKRAARISSGQIIPVVPVGAQDWSSLSGLTGRALRTGQPVVVPDVDLDEEYLRHIPETESEVVIPIVGGPRREVVGALDIQAFTKNAFPPATVAQLQSLATQVNTALSMAQLSERLEREQRVLERLAKVAPAVVKNFNLDRVYDLILEAAFSLLPTASSVYMLTVKTQPDSGQRTLVLLHRLDAPKDRSENRAPRDGRCLPPLTEFRDQVGVTGRAVRLQQTQNVPDVRVDPDHLAFSSSTLSELAIPISLGNQVIAVLNIESDALDGFSSRDQMVAELLAAEAGLALSNAQDFARKIELLNIVVTATREVLTNVDDSNRLIDAILEGAMRVTNSLDGYCALIRREGTMLKVLREVGQDLLPDRRLDWTIEEGLTGRAIRERHPVYVPDTRLESAYISTNGRMLTDLVVPLFNSEGDTVGAITLESPSLNAFDGYAVDALQQFGPPVVAALIKSELVDSLRQRQKETIDLIHQVAHLLGHPVETLRSELPALVVDSAQADGSAAAALDFLLLVVDWLRSQAEVLGQDVRGRHDPTDLSELVARAARAYRYYANRKEVQLSIHLPQEPVYGLVNSGEVLGAVVELLSNAVKYSSAGGAVTVTVRQITSNEVRLTVDDQGRGVPAEEQAAIFSRGRRGANAGDIKGSGLGLYFVKTAVERQQGHVELESPYPTPDGPCQGSRFIIRVPAARHT